MEPRASGLVVLVVGALAALLVACSSSSSSTTVEPFDAGPTATSTDAGTDGASAPSWDQCTALAPSSVVLDQKVGTGDAPTPTGGTIVPGTYVLTDYTVYGASTLTGDTEQAIRVFDDRTFEQLLADSSSYAGVYTVSGSTISFVFGCSCREAGGGHCSMSSSDGGGPYTATATTFVSFFPYANGGTAVATYTKR